MIVVGNGVGVGDVGGGAGVVGKLVVGALGGLEICALLIEMSLYHGKGGWRISADLGGGEVGKCGEMPAIDG